VAFALAACREHLAQDGQLDLSEQFLYWAAKTQTAEPEPDADGTFIEFGRDALETEGLCERKHWLYDPNVIAGNQTHESNATPSAAAKTDAQTWSHQAAVYDAMPAVGGYQAVFDALQKHKRPVAITVPVFSDPAAPGSDNWNTRISVLTGRVFEPVPSSVASGGHAVCVTGFVPDANETTGGWFVFRNSWGDNWASTPVDLARTPERGYGHISATYVDDYLWELCCL